MILQRDLLSQISDNIKATGVEKVAIVSIMGAYRTGKSFLLDLFLRYLRYLEKQSNDKLSPSGPDSSVPGNDKSSCPDEVGRTRSADHTVPSWLREEGDIILEGRSSNTCDNGFHWRGGMDKCTQGIWLWSEPFVLQRRSSDDVDSEKIAVLLLDSQGAFDSQMTKEQSATIFGLTAALSSHQIYNISMQIQEDKIESLHYFMECARSCSRFLSKNEADEVKLFQHLEFLVRDWPNFEESWDLDACANQMDDHMRQHIENARDTSTPEAIKSMFDRVSCWLLPHPGLKINKIGWDGSIADLSPDFVLLLDAYVKRTFGPALQPRMVLGKPLTASTLVGVTNAFVEAFKDLVPKGANLATAIAVSSNLMAKDQALSDFKSSMDRAIESGSGKGLKEEDFVKIEKKTRMAALDSFLRATNFGPAEDRDSIKAELVSDLESLRAFYESVNRRKMEAALTVFSGLMLLVVILYVIDKISDFTCDWYSETCVKISNALFLIYFTIIVAVLTNIYLVYHSRGQTVAVMAVFELGKASVTLLLDYSTRVRRILSDVGHPESTGMKDELSKFFERMFSDMTAGMRAIHVSLREAWSMSGGSQ